MTSMYKNKSGMTLVELLVTIVVIAILTTIAVPNYFAWQKRQESQWFHQNFASGFNLARSTVVTYHRPVIMCGSSSINSVCDHQWDQGIAVFVDSNDNRQYDANERMVALYAQQFRFGTTKLRISRGDRIVRFEMDRGAPAGYYGSFAYCADDPRYVHAFIFNKMGITRLATDSDGDGVRDDKGADIDCS